MVTSLARWEYYFTSEGSSSVCQIFLNILYLLDHYCEFLTGISSWPDFVHHMGGRWLHRKYTSDEKSHKLDISWSQARASIKRYRREWSKPLFFLQKSPELTKCLLWNQRWLNSRVLVSSAIFWRKNPLGEAGVYFSEWQKTNLEAYLLRRRIKWKCFETYVSILQNHCEFFLAHVQNSLYMSSYVAKRIPTDILLISSKQAAQNYKNSCKKSNLTCPDLHYKQKRGCLRKYYIFVKVSKIWGRYEGKCIDQRIV